MVLVLLGGALFGLNSEDAEFEDIDTVTEEDGFAACTFVSARVCVRRVLREKYLWTTATD